MSVVIIKVRAIQASGRYWTCRVVTDRRNWPGNVWTRDTPRMTWTLASVVCVIENRVCMGDIRATKRRK